MKKTCKRIYGLLIVASAVLTQGCLTVMEESFKLNAETGMVEQGYHDIRSRKGLQEKDYSIEDDWKGLKKLIEEELELDKDVVKAMSKELFEEDKTLAAKVKMQIKCPKCFPDRAAILAFIYQEHKDWRFEVINDELFLYVPPNRKIVSTNGKKVETKANSLIIWEEDATVLEFRVTGVNAGGQSLLPFYRKDGQKVGPGAFP
jgi:hypothetical protein